MTVQEIFNTPAVQAIEIEILDLQFDSERRTYNADTNKIAIQHLLKVRKHIIDSMFVMDEEYKEQLRQFNEEMIEALKETRNQTIKMHEAALEANLPGAETTGKCFLGYNYSKTHPIQTMRAKKIWSVLNGTYDSFMPLYDGGVTGNIHIYADNEYESVNHMLYLDESIDNWNEHLDSELTKDMHLCYAFHNLWDHMEFSIFDLLWVRDFNIEVTCESTHNNKGIDEPEDLDWSKCDYYD